MLTKSQVLDAIKKSLVLYKREILDSEYSTRKYVDDSISNINDLPLLSSICMKNEDGSLIKSGVNYLLDFSKIPVDDTKFYLDDVSSTGKVFSNTVLGFEKDGVVNTNLRFRLNSNFPIISLGYRTSDKGIYISNRYSTISYIIDSNERTVSELYSLSEKVNKSQVITISNKTEYTPTDNYHPATKKYVDDSIKDAEVIQKITGTDTVPIKLWELENGYYEVTGKYYDTLSSSTNITSEGLPELFVVDKHDNTSIVYSISGGYTMTYTLNNGVLESDDNAVWTYNVSNNMVLELDNTEPYEPTGDYNPATKKYVDDAVANGGGGNSLTDSLKANYDAAYAHSTSAHAPVNAQKNSDITKAEIEAKLTGNITTHTHSQYLTEHQSLTGYAKTADLAKVATSGSYNDLSNKPTIPSIDGLATTNYVDSKVAGIVNSAPETLDTLNELATALGNDANFATTVSNQIGSKVDKVNGKGLSTNDLTNELKTNYDAAYTHSTSVHAPSNAQKNSDITKSEIEAKLTGNITTHTHSQYLTSIPSEYITETELTSKGYATAVTYEEVKTTVNQILGGAYIE